MADLKLTQKPLRENPFKRIITRLVLLAFLNQNLAFATHSIIELDFKDSQIPQRLHVIPRMSNVGDVSHLEIDTEQKQAALYLKEKQEEALDDLQQDLSQSHEVSVTTKPVILQKHNIINLPWELEPEQLTLFILNHTAWLSPLNEDSYKLEFRGRLLGGGGAQSTGGGGGSSNGGSGEGCRNESHVDCDSNGNCSLTITLCMGSPPSNNSNDHSISGTSHHGGNDRTGGYGSSSSSGVSSGHGSSGVSVGCYVAPDLSRHPHSTDPREIALWQQNIILNYPRENVAHYLKKNAFIPKDDVKDKLLDDALLQVVLDYNGDMSSPMKIALETLSYITRQDLRNMLNGLEQTRNYTVPLSKANALKRLMIMSDMYIEMVSPDFWGVGPGSDCFNWGQLKKINAKSAITKVLVPQLFNKGMELLKTSGQPVYKGSKYFLTQNRNGELSVACPYNGLVYPLFAEDRPVGESYIPRTYVYDPLLDQSLWKTVHQYVNGTLSKSPYSTTWKEYIYHTEPAFYVVRTALKEAVQSEDYTSLALPSSLEQQLEKALRTHFLLTPLFNQDSALGITKYLTPALFKKGVGILKSEQQIRNPFFEPYEQFKHIQYLTSKEKTWEAVYQYSDPLGYDREFVKSIDWKASPYSFEKYLKTYNPFYQDYGQIKEIHRLINTVKTYDEVFKYSAPFGYDKEFVRSIEWKKPMPSFNGYMTEVFDDQVLEDWGTKDWREVFIPEEGEPQIMQVNLIMKILQNAPKGVGLIKQGWQKAVQAYKGEIVKGLKIDKSVENKLTQELGNSSLSNNAKGLRWGDIKGNNQVRIMQPNKDSQHASQHIQYVQVRRGGKVIGRNQKEVKPTSSFPSPKDNPEAHIPYEEWVNWRVLLGE